MRILIVEDDPVALEMLRDVLEGDGHQIDTAGDWSAMTERLMTTVYDTVFLDIGLPGVRGDALVSQIRVTEASTRVILFSGLPEAELREIQVQTGADAILPKERGVQRASEVLEAVSVGAVPRSGPPASGGAAPRRSTVAPPGGPPAPAPPPPPPPPVTAKGDRGPRGLPDDESLFSIPPWRPEAEDEDEDWLPRVLLVDADPTRRESLLGWFQARRFECKAFPDGDAAWAAAQVSAPPDLVILDNAAMGVAPPELVARLRAGRGPHDLVAFLISEQGEGASGDRPSPEAFDQVLPAATVLRRLPQLLANRIKTMRSLRRLRSARGEDPS